MTTPVPLTKDLVLIGGGHTHALVLRRWGMSPLAGARLTVINPGPTAPYSGMLPGFVAGHYDRDALDIDLVKLARFASARIIVGRAGGLDPINKTITIEGRGPISYDLASVDIGITSEMPTLPGFAEHGIPAKPLGRFAHTWDAFRETATAPQVVVIGGGVAGAELSMAMAHALARRGHQNVVSLLDRGPILEEFSDATRDRLLAAMTEQGVTCIEGADVVEVTAGAVVLADGRELPSGFTTGAAGARPQEWLVRTGLDTHQGFLTVGPTLQTSDDDVFAVGDCAHLAFDPRPKAGVYAVRQAPVLFDNLQAHLVGSQLGRYRPQRDYLKLISLGGKSALAEKLGKARKGPLLWRLKDHIDQKFMRQFKELPTMAVTAPLRAAEGVVERLGAAPLCAGCGAKVGSDALSAALADLPSAGRKDVLSRPGDDAAILQFGKARQVISVDHLSAVTEDPAMMARIAAIHALGDVWAMGATPQAALMTLILPRMSDALQRRTLTEITLAASDVMTRVGAEIVGGHTTQGAGMTIGFTVTGLAQHPPIGLKGAQPGDAILLTKPIGSGTILAAEMRGLARGEDVLTCLEQMTTMQDEASRILGGAHAMTDVTGFGLAGHLSAICRASGVGALLDQVPVMDGAMDLTRRGVRSTIFEDNIVGSLPVNGPAGPTLDLLFDPQTCGGLLAAIAGARADAVLQELIAKGYPAARIGTIVEGGAISLS